MRSKLYKITQAAGFALALAFTFSCGEVRHPDDEVSSSSGNGISSSSDGGDVSSSSGGSSLTGTSGTFTDSRDNKPYKWVKIGEQYWMAENLNYRGTEPDTLGRCYDNDPANCTTYGRLYDLATALTACPGGWHIPSTEEWRTLTDFVGSSAGTKLKATSGWNDYDGKSGNGTDNYGFSALPGGHGELVGFSYDVGDRGYWWSSSESGSNLAYFRCMLYNYNDVLGTLNDKGGMLSVRCLKD